MALDDMHPSEVGGAGRGGDAARPPPSRAGVPQNPTRDSRPAGLGRRAFLVGLVAGLGLVAAGGAWARGRVGARATGPPLAGLLRHQSSAAAIGARYLRDRPEERSAALRLAAPPSSAGADRSAWHDALRLESSRDFAEGRVVRVDGWILSRTEARLCAAVELGAGR